MNAHARLCRANRQPLIGPPLRALGSHLAAWAETCADYYRAAARYEELAGLSEAELNRRGLSRPTLAWDIVQTCDRTNDRARLTAPAARKR